jgi:hypothetical protein
MGGHFLKGPFDGIEGDTATKRDRTLQSLFELQEDCESSTDRKNLWMTYDIVSRLDLKTYK